MSVTRTSTVRSSLDHFQPELNDDPQAQRRLRGQLEQIDYTAFIANRDAIAAILGSVSAARFEKLAVATAKARAEWGAAALALAEQGRALSASEKAALTLLRESYVELSEAYEALRRMVERGYLAHEAAPSSDAA
jgi:long-subunit acyl-CoA synthetase (AMP-forming)